VDQTLAVLRAVLDLQTGDEHVTLRHSQPGDWLVVGEWGRTTGSASMKLL
jgi:hypothetical protein